MTELKRMYLDDQKARRRLSAITDRHEFLLQMFLAGVDDCARVLRVLEIINANQVVSGQDFLCAAVILHHSGDIRLCMLASAFAWQAFEMDYRSEPDEFDPKWLSAAAFDRVRVLTGRRQLFGTQYDPRTGERNPVHPEVTDDLRRQWNVRPLSQRGDKPLDGYGSE